MPRAGSGWYYNIAHDLVVASGGRDARQVRQRYHLQGILTEVNCNIGALTPRRLLAVLVPSLLGNTFVIKAHAAPTPLAQAMMRRKLLRVAYIYRDPRDAMLSAWDNGRKALERGRPNAFSHLTGFEQALEFMLTYIRISQEWMGVPQALHTRYEALKDDYDAEAARLTEFLRVDALHPEIQAVLGRYRPGKARPGQAGMHFNKGQSGRYRQRFTPEQQETLARSFGPYLQEMGYPL